MYDEAECRWEKIDVAEFSDVFEPENTVTDACFSSASAPGGESGTCPWTSLMESIQRRVTASASFLSLSPSNVKGRWVIFALFLYRPKTSIADPKITITAAHVLVNVDAMNKHLTKTQLGKEQWYTFQICRKYAV